MDEEIWKDIEGYEGLYQVSNLGRVRSLDSWIRSKCNSMRLRKGRIINQRLSLQGYKRVHLSKGNTSKHYVVHRLVAEAFIPNPDNLPQVNHINEFDKTDNKVENLEWCTQEYNHNYGTHNKRVGEKQSKPVYQYTLDNQLVKVWKSTAECRRNGFNNVSACCRGVLITVKGFRWSYTPLEAS